MKILLSFALLSIALTLPAAGRVPPLVLSDVKIGTLVTGPQFTLEDAAGRVVLFVFWHRPSGRDLTSLRAAEKIANTYRDKLLVLAKLNGDATDDVVQTVAKKNRLSYTMTKGDPGPFPYTDSDPWVIIFNSRGREVFHGTLLSRGFHLVLKTAIDAAPAK